MTFLKIIKHNITFFFICLLLNFSVLVGQSPVITQVSGDFPLNNLFSPNTQIFGQAYNADLDILAISIKDRIIIWTGNSGKELLSKGNAFLDINKSGKVYFVLKNEIGIIEDVNKPLAVRYLLRPIVQENEHVPISDFKLLDGVPFLFSGNKIIKYDGKYTITVVQTKNRIDLLKAGNSGLFYSSQEYGLRSIRAEFKQDSTFSAFFKGRALDLVIEAGEKMYVLDSQGKLYLIQSDNKPMLIFEFPAEFKGRYTSGIFYNNKIAIGTENKGLAIIDLTSKEVSFQSKKNGLSDNSIRAIFWNKAGFLILVHSNSISRIYDPSCRKSIDYATFTDCKIDNLFKINDEIFLASENGIFHLTREKVLLNNGYFSWNQSLSKIPGCESKLISVLKAGSENLFLSKQGIYILRKNQFSLIQSTRNLICAYQPVCDSTLLLLGLPSGIQLLKFTNPGFKVVYEKLNFPASVEAISETAGGSIVVKTRDNRFFTFPLGVINKTGSKESLSEFKAPIHNSESKLFFNGKNLFIYSTDSVVIYDEIQKKFVALKYPPILQSAGLTLEPVSSDHSGIWFTGKSAFTGLVEGIFKIRFESSGLKLIRSPGIENSITGSVIDLVSMTDAKIVYLTNDKIIFKNDTSDVVGNLHLSGELTAGDARFWVDNLAPNENGKEIRLSHGNNFLNVKFHSNYPDAERAILYRYKLEGESREFSNWSTNSQINFNTLSGGNFLLRIEARSIDQSATGELRLPFHINRSAYLKWYMILTYIVIIFSGVIVYVRWKSYIFLKDKIKLESVVSQRTEELQNEKEKSEQLLANILPKDTADELKKKGKASSQKYDLVTVLFSDIQGFTKIAEQMNPEALIDQLDNFYFHFDSVVEKYNIEKIKTIGDAYMCAGGIPEKNRTNPVEVVLAALEVQDYMKEMKKKNSDIWDVRIGIHTGPVIAGVIGHKKFSYDIWGDTVNTASRMESSGEASKINISGHTYELVKDFFICEYRGKMPVKYKGEIDMYFVKGIRPELSVDLYRIPNKNFFIHLQKLRLVDLEEFIFQTFETEAGSKLYFHNNRHTMEVYSLIELLGRAEGVSEEELLMARTAALMGDTGYLSDYNNSTVKSIDFAREHLARFRYSENQIQQVVQLLQSIDKATANSTLIERIIADAETVYFGRVDFIILAENLFREMHEMQVISSKEAFIGRMNKMLNEHRYFTESAKRLQEIDFKEQLEQLKKLA